MEHQPKDHQPNRHRSLGYDGDEYGTGLLGLLNYIRCERPVLFVALVGWAVVLFFLPELLGLARG